MTQEESGGRGEPSLFPLRADRGRTVKGKVTDECASPRPQHSRCQRPGVMRAVILQESADRTAPYDFL